MSGVVAAIIGAAIGWFGSYHVQYVLHRQARRIDRLRQSFYDYLSLANEYWNGAEDDAAKRKLLEGRMTVQQRIIMLEYSQLAKADPKMNKSYVATEDARTRLWMAATGGCFQGSNWTPSPERVTTAASAAAAIVSSFPE